MTTPQTIIDLRDWCLRRLAEHEAASARDPAASSVRLLMNDLRERLAEGDIDHETLSALAKSIADEALVARARRLSAKTAPQSWDRAVARAFAPFENAPFEIVRQMMEQTKAGIVFTAHPTFALSREARRLIGDLASAGLGRDQIERHTPVNSISLLDEHEDVQGAIGRAQDAIRLLIGESLAWLRVRHQERWREVAPAPISLATWVGYDLDGRTDIHWSTTVRLRLEEKALQLFRYAKALQRIAPARELAAALADAGAEAAEQASLFAGDLSQPAAVVAAANRLTSEGPQRLTSLRSVRKAISSLVADSDDEAALALAVIRSEMDLYGLGVARVHLRVNAAQIRSALRAELGLENDRAFLDRTALDAASAKTADAERRAVNFASVFEEQMTARRQFMLCAQILKHVDEETPIRFLIAEVEAPATVMGALYLARLYGVDHHLDISPLFETPDAIERGGRLMERLLEEEEYIDYIRRRGRLSIQCGFSDSGRFMGQIAADLAIERLQILVSKALAAKRVTDVEVVVFNTHGESMGRGAHPGDFRARLDFLMSPWARSRFSRDGLRLNAEVSFQGGDGYLHFQTPSLADATVQEVFAWSQSEPDADREDRYYKDINFSWDVYRAIKGWQEDLWADENYQTALAAFSRNLLPASGSRRLRRPQPGAKEEARSLRAIPHNAVLQQLAALANVVGGVGTAAEREPDRFRDLVAGSARMRSVLGVASAARRLTSLSILRTYGSLYDPAFWTVTAARLADRNAAGSLHRIAMRLEARALDIALGRLANLLSIDRQKFDTAMALSEATSAPFSPSLYMLHAARLALIADGFALTAATPAFSSRHELTHDDLIDMALELRFEDVARVISEIFPETTATPAGLTDISEDAPRNESVGGYPQIQREIVVPLRALDSRIKEIAAGISHFYDAFG
ncbi:MAG: phosphoenolpyruvate carboxylase [Parvularculaceae bacterium]|nr:phosphoenolpyruvate carboxylase [Parvularculaceae bacterium]